MSNGKSAPAGYVMVPRGLLERVIDECNRQVAWDAQDELRALLAAPAAEVHLDELPGMWHESDLAGGETDCYAAPQPVSDDVAKDAYLMGLKERNK